MPHSTVEELEGGILRIAGSNKCYYPIDWRNVWLTLRAIAVSVTYDPTYPDRPPRVSLGGTGELSDGATLAIIGDSVPEARRISVTIHLGYSTLPGGHTAYLGFMPRDLELGIDQEYFAQLDFPTQQLDELVASVRAGRLKALDVCLSDLQGLYVDSREVPRGFDFFLRRGGESALGNVRSLAWREQEQILPEAGYSSESKRPESDEDSEPEVARTTGPVPDHRHALRDITVAIQFLAGAVMGAALLIALIR